MAKGTTKKRCPAKTFEGNEDEHKKKSKRKNTKSQKQRKDVNDDQPPVKISKKDVQNSSGEQHRDVIDSKYWSKATDEHKMNLKSKNSKSKKRKIKVGGKDVQNSKCEQNRRVMDPKNGQKAMAGSSTELHALQIEDSNSKSDFEECQGCSSKPVHHCAPETKKGKVKKNRKQSEANSGSSKKLRKTEEDHQGCSAKKRTNCRQIRRTKQIHEKNQADHFKDGNSSNKVCKKEMNPLSALPAEIGESKYWNRDEFCMSGEHSTESAENKAKVVEEDSDSSSDWEEVQDLPGLEDQSHDDINDQLPDQPVEIILQRPDVLKKRGKRGFDIHDWFRLQMNKYKKKTQTSVHKVHLLCLLSVGIHLNSLCNDLTLWGQALSLVPSVITDCQATREWQKEDLNKLITWFIGEFTINSELVENTAELGNKLEKKEVASVLELVLMFVITCRALGLQTRLVHSLQPVTFKPSDLKLKTPKDSTQSQSKKIHKEAPVISDGTKSLSSKLSSLVKTSPVKESTRKPASKPRHSTKKRITSDEGNLKQLESRPRNRPQRRCSSSVCYMEPSEESDLDLTLQQVDGQNDKKIKAGSSTGSQSSDDDFQEEITFRNPISLTKKRPRSKATRVSGEKSINSSDEGYYYWSEVFLEKENSWLCIDCIEAELNHPENMELRVTKPLSYVLGYDNDGLIKDVTKRYASSSLQELHKLRIDPDWWDETLKPYGPKTAAAKEKDAREESQLQDKLMMQPFPKTINEFKNHPLYTLKRHLLKFEALYPESAVPLGYIRKEPIYARECVHTLHSRENWLKEGRVVKIGEQPYKMVKSRKRPSVHDKNPSKQELLTPLYGQWQTEEYVPPTAVDGKVPKNEYGNVELFKPSMIPGGTVHLKLEGLNKIAKKLDIDCAPAMVGWEQHAYFAHPLMDGFIVCEEHKDILISAWNEEQMILYQKEAEKKQKRAEDNWKRLVKGLLLREKMKIKFNLQEPNKIMTQPCASTENKTRKADDVALSWPRNLQIGESVTQKKETSAPFPFEVEQL